MIEVKQLEKSFSGFRALDGVNMHVKKVQFTGLWVQMAPENLR